MIELPMFESIPVKPRSFFVLTPSCRTLSQLPGDRKMKCHKELCRDFLGRLPRQEFCDCCQGIIWEGYHSEEY